MTQRNPLSHHEHRNGNHSVNVLTAVGAWIAVILSFISLGMWFWRGGTMEERVAGCLVRVERMEKEGSAALQAYAAMDGERYKVAVARLERSEDSMTRIATLEARLASLRETVDSLVKLHMTKEIKP